VGKYERNNQAYSCQKESREGVLPFSEIAKGLHGEEDAFIRREPREPVVLRRINHRCTGHEMMSGGEGRPVNTHIWEEKIGAIPTTKESQLYSTQRERGREGGQYPYK